MGDYKIKSIGKVDFRTYKDVVRVIAIKKEAFGLLCSLLQKKHILFCRMKVRCMER